MQDAKDSRRDDEKENTEDTLRVSAEESDGPEPAKRTAEEVRQGHTGDNVRYMLFIGVGGAVVLFAVLYFAFAR